MKTKRYALIREGAVEQVAFFEHEQVDAQWLAAVTADFDYVADVTGHPYAVNVNDSYSEAEGFRPPSPYPSWSWNGTAWEAPVPKPDGPNWYWDEYGQKWDYVGPPLDEQPTIANL